MKKLPRHFGGSSGIPYRRTDNNNRPSMTTVSATHCWMRRMKVYLHKDTLQWRTARLVVIAGHASHAEDLRNNKKEVKSKRRPLAPLEALERAKPIGPSRTSKGQTESRVPGRGTGDAGYRWDPRGHRGTDGSE